MKVERKTEIIDMLCSCCNECTPDSYFKDLRKFGEKIESNNEFVQLTNFGMAISSLERLILLKSLKEQDRCVCELEVVIDKSQSTVSHHLRKLEIAGLISGYKKGNYTYYHLEEKKLKGFNSIIGKEFDF